MKKVGLDNMTLNRDGRKQPNNLLRLYKFWAELWLSEIEKDKSY